MGPSSDQVTKVAVCQIWLASVTRMQLGGTPSHPPGEIMFCQWCSVHVTTLPQNRVGTLIGFQAEFEINNDTNFIR